MPVTLQPKERDALWVQITSNLTLFGDFDRAMHEGDEERCYRLGRTIADSLRLILDGGLGWQARTAEPTILTLPDLELRGVMARMKEQAVLHYESRRPDAEEAQAVVEEIAAVRDAADSVWEQTRHA